MTEAEKNELKAMLDAGFISLAEYNDMTGEAQTAPIAQAVPVAQATPAPIGSIAQPTLQAEATWHVAINGQAQGPFNKQTLTDMLASGQLTRDSNIWAQGMPAWVKAETVAELGDLWLRLPPPIPTAVPHVAPITPVAEAKAPEAVVQPASSVMRGKMLPLHITNRLRAYCEARGWKVFQRLSIYGELLPLVLIGDGVAVLAIDMKDEAHWHKWVTENFRNAIKDIKKGHKGKAKQDNLPALDFKPVRIFPIVLSMGGVPDFAKTLRSWECEESLHIFDMNNCQAFEAFINKMGEQKGADLAELDRIATGIVGIVDPN